MAKSIQLMLNKITFIQVLHVLFKEHIQHPIRGAAIIVAMAIGCAGLTSVLVINETAKQSYNMASQPLVSNVHYVVAPKNGERIDKADYAKLRRQGHTGLVAVTEKRFSLLDNKSIQLLGIDYYALINLANNKEVTPQNPVSNIIFDETARYFIHPDIKNNLQFETNSQGKFIQLADRSIGPVAEFAGTGMGPSLIADVGIVYEDFPDSQLSYLLVVGEKQSADMLSQALPPHLYLKALVTGEDAKTLTSSFHMNLFAMGLLMFVVCLFVIMNALHLLMNKRIRTYKILRQMGVPIRTLTTVSLMETGLISSVGSVMGVVVGVWFASLLSPAVNQTLASLYNVSVGTAELSLLEIFLQCWGACLLGGLAACFLPLQQVNQKLTSLSSQQANPNRWFWISILLLALALFLSFTVDDVLRSFIVICLVIFAGCFFAIASIPWILKQVKTKISTNYPIIHWSISDALRVSSKSNIAFCAFFIAVVANIGMNLMVDSFRTATQSWIEQRLDADAYIYTNESLKITNWIAQQYPDIQTVIRQQEEGSFQQQSIEVRSFPLSKERRSALKFEEAFENVWQAFSNKNGALINQQFALSQNLSLGQSFTINTETLGKQQLLVAGIYPDYGNPQKQLLLPPNKVKEPENGRNIIALYLPQVEGARIQFDALMGTFKDTHQQSDLIKTEQLLVLSMETFDRTFVITQGLNIITLLVAAFSLTTSILIIDKDNAPQRALIKSLGVGANRLLVTTLTQYSMLCLLICLLAIPFGLGLSWLLINLVNVHAFHWTYPLVTNISVLTNVVWTSITLIILTVFFPAFKTAKYPLLRELKWLQR